jgi:hypothetical protein
MNPGFEPGGGASDPAFRQPPLTRLHSDDTLETGSNRYALESVRKMTTRQILDSLMPDAMEPLTVKRDGTIMDGNSRVKVLEERGYDINSLPRTLLP